MTIATTSDRADSPASFTARVSYAALFAVVLPLLLVGWAVSLDEWLRLPVLESREAAITLLVSGTIIQIAAVRDLWMHGRGLPASPFPPQRLVSRGMYRVVAHPIYLGAVVVAFGLSLAAQSPGGFWVVSPTLGLSAAAFVIGFERDATARRFGPGPTPLLVLPADRNERPSGRERLAVYVLVFLPWLLLYQAVEFLGVPPDAVSAYLAWERRIPIVPWTESIYAATYLFVAAAPLIASTRRDLRTFAVRGLWATATVIPIYLLVPLIAPPRAVDSDGFWSSLMQLERAMDQPVTAFPAFHVIWMVFAACVWALALPRLRVLWWAFVGAVSVSCITTGMHAVVDVVAGVAVSVAVMRGPTIRRRLCDVAEWIANAWGEITIGPVRFLSHGLFAAVGAMAGVLVAISLAGADATPWIVLMTVAAIAGAGLWGQLVEGSPRLLRPYGYFGSVIGVALSTLAAAVAGADAWVLFTAFGIGGAYAQAIGRMRCLTQGCCHGRETAPSLGIRYTHPRSRVVRIAGLRGKPLHPTPLYSALWMLAVGSVLLRLWTLAVPVQFIAGLYFILAGLGRFVEEHYRGEPQTAIVGGLRLYQWLAIGSILCGATLTTLGSNPVPPVQMLDPSIIPAVMLLGVMAYVAYGLDFPRSTRRFARLV
jgi:protein-S-isoprenylcysteine O-methyltransferase Ste14